MSLNKECHLSLFNGNGYSRVANDFLNELPKLKPASIAVYLALCGHCGAKRLAWPSGKRVAALTGYNRARVVEATQDIEARGLIERTKHRKNRVIVWKIPIHPIVRNVRTIEQDTESVLSTEQYVERFG